MSSATPAAAPMPENRALVTTTPGTRKATYDTPSTLMAPPKM
jgi:hypothetical protein